MKLKAVFIRLLVYFHLAAILCNALPSPPENMKIGVYEVSLEEKIPAWPAYILAWNQVNLRPIFESYMIATGSQQYWNMFAPMPIHSNI